MKKFIYLTLIALSTLFIQSCSSTTGCTDPNASNFNADADEDCKCCNYKGEVVFWYGKELATLLQDAGVTSLKVFVDGQLKASAANVYFNAAPNCGANGSMTTSFDLGSVKNKSYEYQIKDQDNDIVAEGVVNYTANTCLKLEITP